MDEKIQWGQDAGLPPTEDEIGQTEDEIGQTEDEIGQTEDEIGQTEDEIGQTEDEIGQTEDEIAQTEDGIPETEDEYVRIRSEAAGKKGRTGASGTSRAQREEKRTIKRDRTSKPNAAQIKRVLFNLLPYMAALFLLWVIALGVTGIARSSVEAYCEEVYQEYKEYFSYE